MAVPCLREPRFLGQVGGPLGGGWDLQRPQGAHLQASDTRGDGAPLLLLLLPWVSSPGTAAGRRGMTGGAPSPPSPRLRSVSGGVCSQGAAAAHPAAHRWELPPRRPCPAPGEGRRPSGERARQHPGPSPGHPAPLLREGERAGGGHSRGTGTGARRAVPAAPAAGEPRRGFGGANGAAARDARSPINAIY